MSRDDVTREMCNAWKTDPTVASVVTSSLLSSIASHLMAWPGIPSLSSLPLFLILAFILSSFFLFIVLCLASLMCSIGARVAQDDIFVSF